MTLRAREKISCAIVDGQPRDLARKRAQVDAGSSSKPSDTARRADGRQPFGRGRRTSPGVVETPCRGTRHACGFSPSHARPALRAIAQIIVSRAHTASGFSDPRLHFEQEGLEVLRIGLADIQTRPSVLAREVGELPFLEAPDGYE